MGERVKNKDAEAAQNDSKPDGLDEGLDDTFPGSDPVSSTQPGKAPGDEEPSNSRK